MIRWRTATRAEKWAFAFAMMLALASCSLAVRMGL